MIICILILSLVLYSVSKEPVTFCDFFWPKLANIQNVWKGTSFVPLMHIKDIRQTAMLPTLSGIYHIRGNFSGFPIFAVFRGQYESAKIKIAKYFPISVEESSLDATSIFAAVTSSLPLLR